MNTAPLDTPELDAHADIVAAIAANDIPRAVALSLGTRYRIVDLLGQGGMGIVFKAEDTETGTLVAVKAMLTEDEHPDRRMRFWREVRAMQEVRHDNVVKLIAHSDEHAPLPYLILEYIEGTTLWAVLNVNPMPEDAALCVLAEMADALAAIHAKLIVHRDLKPENIFVQENGRVVIGDFGIVRGELGASDTFVRTKTTALGTPHFASPEHLMAPNLVSTPADVFSLGCLFHALLTGTSPFAADNVSEALARLGSNQRTPPPKELSAESRKLLEHMLQRKPDARPKDGSAVVNLLAPILEARGLVDRRGTFAAFLSGEIDNTTTLYDLAEQTRSRDQEASRVEATKMWSTAAGASRGPREKHTRVGETRVGQSPQTRVGHTVTATPKAHARSKAVKTIELTTGDIRTGELTRSQSLKKPTRALWLAVPILLLAGGGAGFVLLSDAARTQAVATPPTVTEVEVAAVAPTPSIEIKPVAPTELPPPAEPKPIDTPKEPIVAVDDKPRPRPATPPPVEAKADKRPATVTFFTKPWAKVTIDGTPQGTTPMFNTTELSPGAHRLRFEHPTHKALEMQVTLQPGERRELKVELKK